MAGHSKQHFNKYFSRKYFSVTFTYIFHVRVLVRDVPDEKLMKNWITLVVTLNGGIDAAVSAAAALLYYDAARQITIIVIWPFCILFVLLFTFFNG